MTRHVRIEYRVREDVDLAQLTDQIAAFVAGMRAHHASHDYTSYRDAKDPRHFVHVGHFDPEAVASLQSQPFFRQFTTELRPLCVHGPEAIQLEAVASTR